MLDCLETFLRFDEAIMSEIARILFEVLKLGRGPEALMARSAIAEQRSLQLSVKAKRFIHKRPKKAQRLMDRAAFWEDRADSLKVLARARGAIGC